MSMVIYLFHIYVPLHLLPIPDVSFILRNFAASLLQRKAAVEQIFCGCSACATCQYIFQADSSIDLHLLPSLLPFAAGRVTLGGSIAKVLQLRHPNTFTSTFLNTEFTRIHYLIITNIVLKQVFFHPPTRIPKSYKAKARESSLPSRVTFLSVLEFKRRAYQPLVTFVTV